MKRLLPSIVWLVLPLVTSACALQPGVTPTGPFQFVGTVFGMEGQKVGQPVPNADVLVTIDDQTRARTTTDGSGHYAFSTLEAGRFTLRISAPGFVTLTPLVDLDRDMRADFALTRQ